MKAERSFRFLFLILLLIPCWAIFIRYEVDLTVIHYVASLLPSTPLMAYEPKEGLARYFYGPFSLVLIRPLATLSFAELKIFWLALQTVSFFLFWHYLDRLFPALREKRAFWKWLIIWVFAINPIHNNFQSNNIQLMLAAALILTEWFRDKSPQRQMWAGALCVFATAVKVFPLFLLCYYLLIGTNRLRWGAVAAAVVSGVAPLVLFGPETGVELYRSFFRNLTTYQGDNSFLRVPDILCLPSLLTRTLASHLSMDRIGQLIFWVTAIISVAFFLFAWLHRRNPSVWALGWAVMVLLNPSTRVHYLVFAIPVCCLFLKGDPFSKARRYLTLGGLAGMAMLALTTETVVGKVLNDKLEFWNVPTWGLVLLCALAPFLIVRERRTAASA